MIFIGCSENKKPDLVGKYGFYTNQSNYDVPVAWDNILGPTQNVRLYGDSTFEFLTTNFKTFNLLNYSGSWTFNNDMINLHVDEIHNLSESESHSPENYIVEFSLLSNGNFKSTDGYVLGKLSGAEAIEFMDPSEVSLYIDKPMKIDSSDKDSI